MKFQFGKSLTGAKLEILDCVVALDRSRVVTLSFRSCLRERECVSGDDDYQNQRDASIQIRPATYRTAFEVLMRLQAQSLLCATSVFSVSLWLTMS